MYKYAFVPYLIIAIGIGLGLARIRPAMITWVACALGVLCGLIIAFIILRNGNTHHWVFAAIAVAPFAVAVPMVIKDLSYPRINDVTTDVESPPVFRAALNAPANVGRDMAFPKHNGPIVRESYANLQPLILNEPPDQVFQRMDNLANKQPSWVMTHRDDLNRVLEGEATTVFLGFTDDFVIRVSDNNGKARVDMRSKSREGLVDAGKNAKRIQVFFERLAETQ